MDMRNITVHLFIILFLAYLLQSECISAMQNRSIERKRIITNPRQSDGFGSQFQTIIAAVIYAELNNCQYVYTPFNTMEHNYTNDPDFIAKKEQLINFIDNFELIDHADSNESISANIAYKAFFDANVTQCAMSDSLRRIKSIFRANKKYVNYFNNTRLNIAVHVRRPNSHDNRILGTNTPSNDFLTIINQLRIIYATQYPLFHLYSQGKLEDFKIFEASDVMLHLNELMEDTFLGMVFADILVTSTSSFSYTAALLSDGVIYYTPFWHAPLPHWISVNTLLKG
jgi:hypothetical protein